MSGTILPTVCQIFGGDPVTQLNLKNVKTIWTFSITLAKLEPQWPHSEQRSDVIHGSEFGNDH